MIQQPADSYQIVFLFDARITLEWKQIGWAGGATIFNLADFAGTPGGHPIIADPVGGREDEFIDCYALIEGALREVVRLAKAG